MMKEPKPKKTFKEVVLENLRVIGEAYVIAFVIRLLLLEAFAIPTGSMVPTIMVGDRIIVIKPTYGINFPIVNLKTPGFYKPERGDIIVFKNPTYRSPGFLRELITLMTFSLVNVDNEPKYFVKRVIGLPGDSIDIISNRVYVNGVPLNLEFIDNQNGWSYFREYFNNQSWVIKIRREVMFDDGVVRNFHISNLYYLYDSDTRLALMSQGVPEVYLPNLEYFKNDIDKIKESLKSNRIPEGYYFAMGDNRDESSDSRYWGLVPESLLVGKGVFRFWPINRVGGL
ncbi:MAG: signal peptidase I [Brevinematales bacterium]|nr:signal peptidase I [Brevinematales bacterium]